MKTPNYKIISEDKNQITIQDVGPWNEFPTVTNGAELVVKELADAGKLDGRTLRAIDSVGDMDELEYQGDRFTGFRFIARAPEKKR